MKLVVESDQPVTETARDLGVNVNTLHTWIGKYHRPKASGKDEKNDEHVYNELKCLRKAGGCKTERGARHFKNGGSLDALWVFFARESL